MIERLASISYTLLADIYTANISQDPTTGIVQKSWVLAETINCSARSVIRKGTGDNSVFLEIEDYLEQLHNTVKLRSNKVISTSKAVVNIRNQNGVIYQENQDPSSAGGFNGSTIFDVMGTSPILNYDGRVVEHETILIRREIQKLN